MGGDAGMSIVAAAAMGAGVSGTMSIWGAGWASGGGGTASAGGTLPPDERRRHTPGSTNRPANGSNSATPTKGFAATLIRCCSV